MLLDRRSAPISTACVQSKPVTREPDPVVPTVDVWQLIASQPLAALLVVARTWLSIRFELVSGRGEEFWPRPGRMVAGAGSHTVSARLLMRSMARSLVEIARSCIGSWSPTTGG